MVIWVTGLSASGKTTLCGALYTLLKPRLRELVVLDGDMIRSAFGNDIGHCESDRVIQVQRLQNLAKLLSDQDLVVIVGVVYARPDLLEWNRRNMRDYFEVYLKASLETLRKRDRKKLYTESDSGNIRNVVGVDIPWHAPSAAHLIIDADHPQPPEMLACRIARAVPRLASLLEGADHG